MRGQAGSSAATTRGQRHRSKATRLRRSASLAVALLVLTVTAITTVSAPSARAATVELPDIIGLLDSHEMAIVHPAGGAKELQYSHVVYNAGTGLLAVRPVYDPATGTAAGYQRFYSYNGNTPVLDHETLTGGSFFWHALHNHYHFPLAAFGLFQVNPDGSLGAPVAQSPKNGFCLGDSYRVNPTIPHSPTNPTPEIGPNGQNCPNQNGVVGIDPGYGDYYNQDDPGQSIDVTSVPDGTYWFRQVLDPSNFIQESDETNNVTDVKLTITGNTVTEGNPLSTAGSPVVFDKTVTAEGKGAITSPGITTQSAGELLLAFVASDGGSAAQSSTVTGGGLSWSLVRRANTSSGTAEIWQATAPTVVTNLKVTSTPKSTGFNQSLTVHAVAGSGGVGVSAAASAATGAPSVSVTTTQPGSWVLGVGNDWDNSVPRTSAPGQVMIHQWVDKTAGDTFWHEARSTAVPNPGTAVTLADRLPTGDRWNFAAVELLATSAPDNVPPVVSNAGVSPITTDSATASWITDEPSTSRVEYGTSTQFGSSTALDATLVTNHSQKLTSLSADTSYFCILHSADRVGNEGVSNTIAFRTLAPDTIAPTISAVAATGVTAVQATIGWTTNEPASSAVDYGTTTDYGLTSTADPTLVSTHSQFLVNLLPTTTYHYRVRSSDAAGNQSTSDDATFTTPAAPKISTDLTTAKHGRSAQTTNAFTTAGTGELLVAFVGTDGDGRGQTVKVTGAGLTWTLAKRTNARLGDTEVWTAYAAAKLTSVKVTSTPAVNGFDQSLTVVAFKGAARVAGTATGNGASGAAKTTLLSTQGNSFVYAVGNDWDRAVGRTLGSGQTMVDQWVDTGVGDTFWVQDVTAPSPTANAVIDVSTMAPTNDQWNFTAVEVVPT